MFMGLQQPPPWLSSLQRLEVLWLFWFHCTNVMHTLSQSCPVQEGWEVLAQLPLLRRVHAAPTQEMEPRIQQHVPHMCWK
jgi:hypothetical protein